MIINLGCASDDIHIPRDDIFDNHPNEIFEYGMHFCSVISNCCKPHKVVHHQTKFDIINDGKLFLCPLHGNGQGIKCYHCLYVCKSNTLDQNFII